MSATRIPVRGYHLDVYGHVNNARYLEFLEEARWAYFGEHADLNWWQQRVRWNWITSNRKGCGPRDPRTRRGKLLDEDLYR